MTSVANTAKPENRELFKYNHPQGKKVARPYDADDMLSLGLRYHEDNDHEWSKTCLIMAWRIYGSHQDAWGTFVSWQFLSRLYPEALDLPVCKQSRQKQITADEIQLGAYSPSFLNRPRPLGIRTEYFQNSNALLRRGIDDCMAGKDTAPIYLHIAEAASVGLEDGWHAGIARQWKRFTPLLEPKTAA